MADDKDTNAPKEQPATPTPPQAQRAAQPWITPSPPPDEDESPEVTKAHQDLVKAEREYAEVQLKGKEALADAQAKLIEARAKAAGVNLEDGDFPGYWHKIWAGHDTLQCGYCSWDVITSSLYDYKDRMQQHLAAAHPNWMQMPAIFDQAGNFVEGGVQ
jgi:hypothetical protein